MNDISRKIDRVASLVADPTRWSSTTRQNSPKNRLDHMFRAFLISQVIKIAPLVKKVNKLCGMVGFFLLIKLHREGPAPETCVAGMFRKICL